MSARRFALWGLAAVLVASAAVPVHRSQAAPVPPGEKPALTGQEADVKFIDGSTLKVRLLDEKLELVTKHGTLQVAVADVKRIDIATRIPQAEADKIRLAVLALGSPEHKVRQQASTDLKAVGPRAFAALLKAAQHEDPEVAHRAEELIEFLKAKYSDAQLEARDRDVIHTEDSKIAGTLSAATLRIATFQFGELRLKLADVRAIGDVPDEDELLAASAAAAPPNMTAYANQTGKVYTYTVTGAQPNTGTVYGTNQYTLDSYLALAAVHAGVVKPGQVAVIRVKVVVSPQQYAGTTKNGVVSSQYGLYPPGAYEFVKRKN